MAKFAKIAAAIVAAGAWVLFNLWLWRVFIQAVGGCGGEG